ncbi:MAG TPA: GTPase HflX, partial [Blastocatellia bacterium]|nr:GTPase HflX [Blastocatellia bacterium]
ADVSSPQLENHLNSVNRILEELQLNNIPRLLVFNKADLVDKWELDNLCQLYQAIAISAVDRKTLSPLVDEISARLKSGNSQ